MGSSADGKRALVCALQKKDLRWTIAVGAARALAATAFVLVFAAGTAIAQVTEPGVLTTTTRSSVAPAGDIHPTTIAGIPGLIAIPDHLVSSTPIVVMYHGFGPPSSPEALAKAVPPIPGAISFYPWLPLFGARMDAGGKSGAIAYRLPCITGNSMYEAFSPA